MTAYSFKARDESGKTIKGTQDAGGVDQLAAQLKEKRLYLVSASRKRKSFDLTKYETIKRQDLIDFSYHLSTILLGGIPILEGLEYLSLQRKGTRFGKILQNITEDLEGGLSLHESLAKHPEAFEETYVSMVRAGEASGNLDTILSELAKFLEWQQDLSADIKKVSIYPTTIMLAIGVLVMFVFTFVFPRLYPVLLAFKVELPLSTLILIEVSKICQTFWPVMLLTFVGIVVGAWSIMRLEKGRILVDRLKLKIPVIGGFIWKTTVSRFAHHLSLLLEAGIGIIQSLTLVESVVGNRVIANAIERARDQVQSGATLSDALRRTHAFDPIVLRMIAIGESSGTLSEGLAKAASYYDREIPRAVKKIFAALEPLIILFLAFVVGFVVFSVYTPIYRGIGMIGK